MEFPSSIVIAIAGATCSGKTTLSQHLCNNKPPYHHFIVVHQDHFYKDSQSVPYDSNGMQLWDDPCSIDWYTLLQNIRNTLLNPTTHCNVCTNNKEKKESTSSIHKPPLLTHTVIIEGTMLLHSRELLELCHKSFFITLDYETCNQRRKVAYVNEDKPGFFEGHVWPMYCKMEHMVTTQLNSVTILDGTKSLEEIEVKINSHLADSYH